MKKCLWMTMIALLLASGAMAADYTISLSTVDEAVILAQAGVDTATASPAEQTAAIEAYLAKIVARHITADQREQRRRERIAVMQRFRSAPKATRKQIKQLLGL